MSSRGVGPNQSIERVQIKVSKSPAERLIPNLYPQRLLDVRGAFPFGQRCARRCREESYPARTNLCFVFAVLEPRKSLLIVKVTLLATKVFVECRIYMVCFDFRRNSARILSMSTRAWFTPGLFCTQAQGVERG